MKPVLYVFFKPVKSVSHLLNSGLHRIIQLSAEKNMLTDDCVLTSDMLTYVSQL